MCIVLLNIILIILLIIFLINEFLFPMPFHRLTKYRVVKSTERYAYGRNKEHIGNIIHYIVQRKLLLFYFEFDITSCQRKDGELDYFNKQKDYNQFEKLENAISFIKDFKQMKEQEYEDRKIKFKNKDIVIYKD